MSRSPIDLYLEMATSIAIKNGWREIFSKEILGITIVHFTRNRSGIEGKGIFLEVYISTMAQLGQCKVVTCLRHGRNGASILERPNCNLNDLRSLLKDPRTHTNKGKYVNE